LRELLTAAGLEAMYRITIEHSLKVGAPVLARELFISSQSVMLIMPLELLKALQAGVKMSPIQISAAPARPRLHLTH
jgi:hypothetical protein